MYREDDREQVSGDFVFVFGPDQVLILNRQLSKKSRNNAMRVKTGVLTTT